MQPADRYYLSMSTENSIVIPSSTPAVAPAASDNRYYVADNCWYVAYHVSFFFIEKHFKRKAFEFLLY